MMIILVKFVTYGALAGMFIVDLLCVLGYLVGILFENHDAQEEQNGSEKA
jgi:hypothetical protein